VGGLEIAGLAGVILECGGRRSPVVIDGFISGAASLAAAAIEPRAKEYLLAGHRSQELGHAAAFANLGLRPLLDLDMRLGEGTGAVLARGGRVPQRDGDLRQRGGLQGAVMARGPLVAGRVYIVGGGPRRPRGVARPPAQVGRRGPCPGRYLRLVSAAERRPPAAARRALVAAAANLDLDGLLRAAATALPPPADARLFPDRRVPSGAGPGPGPLSGRAPFSVRAVGPRDRVQGFARRFPTLPTRNPL
jgi:hypothetical protein